MSSPPPAPRVPPAELFDDTLNTDNDIRPHLESYEPGGERPVDPDEENSLSTDREAS